MFRFNRALRTSVGLFVAAIIAACGSQSPSPTPAPAPTAAAPATASVSQTCPDAADGPSIIAQAIEDARRAMAANPSGPVPPACLVTSFARITVVVPDSLTEHALAIAAELDRRGTAPRELLGSEIVLLARARRWQDVSRAYDRLIAIDPQPSLDVMRQAIVAAHERSDTTSLLRLLSSAQARADAPPLFRTEHNILQQTGALRTAIAEARGFIRQNPKYVASYPSLVGNFGTLGTVDSVVAYIGRALRQNVARTTIAPAVDQLVNTMLRHATLYGSGAGWDAQIAAATRVDSALTTPATKFLVASLIVHANEPQIAELGSTIEGPSVNVGGVRPSAEAVQRRAAACQRVAQVVSSTETATARLREGGDRFGGGGAAQLASAIATQRERLAALRTACGTR